MMRKTKTVEKRDTTRRNTTGGETSGGGRGVNMRNNARFRYAECRKNHVPAANIGGNGAVVLDGCQEFMASGGVEGTFAALTCAACGCLKFYHRRE